MNTNDLTAFGTGPPFLFISNKLSYAELPYVLEIVNHTHTILRPIALIQMVQPVAGKAVTTETVLEFIFRYLFTVLDSTRGAGFRFETVFTSAPGACFLISYICPTKATVHSAGGNRYYVHCVYFCRSYLHHIYIPGKGLSCAAYGPTPLGSPCWVIFLVSKPTDFPFTPLILGVLIRGAEYTPELKIRIKRRCKSF
jgi:hypothetical protein